MRRYRDAEVQRYRGAEVQRYRGTEVQSGVEAPSELKLSRCLVQLALKCADRDLA